MWRLPVDDEYREMIKSNIADIVNSGGRWGGAVTAAMFLKEFVGDTPWIHLDIAGVAWMEDNKPWIAKGPSGVAVRSLVEFAQEFAQDGSSGASKEPERRRDRCCAETIGQRSGAVVLSKCSCLSNLGSDLLDLPTLPRNIVASRWIAQLNNESNRGSNGCTRACQTANWSRLRRITIR